MNGKLEYMIVFLISQFNAFWFLFLFSIYHRKGNEKGKEEKMIGVFFYISLYNVFWFLFCSRPNVENIIQKGKEEERAKRKIGLEKDGGAWKWWRRERKLLMTSWLCSINA